MRLHPGQLKKLAFDVTLAAIALMAVTLPLPGDAPQASIVLLTIGAGLLVKPARDRMHQRIDRNELLARIRSSTP